MRSNKLIAGILIIGIISVKTSCKEEVREIEVDFTTQEVIENVPQEEDSPQLFGFSLNDFTVKQEKIKRGQFLSTILNPQGVSTQKIQEIATKSKEIFDIRRLKAGKPYTLFYAPDSTLKYFVYESSPKDYFVIDVSEEDSVHMYVNKREIKIVEKTVSGIIEGSLWQSMINAGASPELAIRLADVYAWSVDFHRIQKGDKFKVIFDEEIIDGKPVGIGKIKAAELEHVNEAYFAINFEDQGYESFFDEKGRSLKKAFLKAPVKFSRISSRYSKSRFHPVLKRRKAHLGTDYAAGHGTPIVSTGNGTVIAASRTRGNGNYVKIKHNSVYTTQYLHMSRFAKGMKKGKKVKQGEIIGYVGSTGLATGPHVCYRFWKHGKQVDPLREKLPPSEPITAENREKFNKHAAEILERLRSIQIFNKEQLAMHIESENSL